MKTVERCKQMLVLLDIEWIERADKSKNLTQLSAIRVGDDWVPRDSYHALILPEELDDSEWEHMAFNGYGTMDFYMSGLNEADCITAFSQWLNEDDVICVWHYTSKITLKKLWKKALNCAPHNRISIAIEHVYEAMQLRGHDQSGKGLYAIAEMCGIEMPEPQHCAKNDVSVLRNVMRRVGIEQAELMPDEQVKIRNAGVEKGKEKDLSELPYNYVYTPASSVFHTKDCRYIQNAERIIGCMTFKTASKNRRPCKVCNPVKRIVAQLDGAEQVPPETWLNSSHSLGDGYIMSVRLINGKRISIAAKNIVGYCKNSIHPGRLTKQLLEEHDCIGKKCRHLQRYRGPYWDNLAEQENSRKQAKEEKKAHKEEQRSQADRLDEVKKELQEYALSTESKMEITSIASEREGVYKVFYVSENSFADGNRFPEFLSLVKLHHPKWRIIFRHVKDLNGRFVTIEQYHKRKRS